MSEEKIVKDQMLSEMMELRDQLFRLFSGDAYVEYCGLLRKIDERLIDHERLRGIEARLREVYDAYVAEESLELDDVLERQRLQYYLTGEV